MRILEDSPAVRVLENRGRNQRDVEIAINMLCARENYDRISLFTGLTTERIAEIASELRIQA